MALDSLTIAALTAELSPLLTGGKIDKIHQPTRDTLVFSLRAPCGNVRLAVSGGVGTARLHITGASFDNPQSPPMFCMLMRKHLSGARIAALYQPDYERMAVLELDALDEMGVQSRKKLIVEMIGRGTNIILVGADGRIIDCLRRVDAEMNPVRQVLPGLIYRLPPKQERPQFFELSPGELAEKWALAPEGKTADRWLTETFAGLSPLLARELCQRALGSPEPEIGALPPEKRRGFPAACESFRASALAGEFTPFMLLQDGSPRDFSCMELLQYGEGFSGRVYPSFSELLDAFYTRRDKSEDMRQKSRSLRKSVRSACERTRRKLDARRAELLKTAGREEVRRRGELITANIHRLKRGMTELVCENYYEDGCPEISIPLDPLKSPQQNAAACFKEYTKARSAEKYLTELTAKDERDLEYLSSVLDELDRAETEADLAEIRGELTATGYLKRRRANNAKERRGEQKPLAFRSSSGLQILVGRNNAQNDRLTMKIARKTDLWLHTQKVHGSHVILRTEGAEPDAKSIEEAASLAAYYSQARGSGKTPVDCAPVRSVKKPPGALPGMVIYTGQVTVTAVPDEALAERLRER